MKTRKNATKAAAFTAADIKAVTGAGAPSYTSGVHMWNGTAETLKPKPMVKNAIPMVSSVDDASPDETTFPMSYTFVLPVEP